MEERQHKMIIIAGAPGTGKTTTALSLIEKYPGKVLIFDVNNEKKYSHFPRVNLTEIKNQQHRVVRVIEEDFQRACEVIHRDYYNGMLVFEEATLYFDRAEQGVYKKILTSYRHRGRDILFLFHSLRRVPPYVYETSNYIVIHKTADHIDVSANKVPNYDEVKAAYDRVNAHKNSYYSETVATRP